MGCNSSVSVLFLTSKYIPNHKNIFIICEQTIKSFWMKMSEISEMLKEEEEEEEYKVNV